MAAQIADAERRRYTILAQQVAAHGYDTPPHVLMEYQELRGKYGPIEMLDAVGNQPIERRRRLELDLDFLATNMAATFRRLTRLESAMQRMETIIRRWFIAAAATGGLALTMAAYAIGCLAGWW